MFENVNLFKKLIKRSDRLMNVQLNLGLAQYRPHLFMRMVVELSNAGISSLLQEYHERY